MLALLVLPAFVRAQSRPALDVSRLRLTFLGTDRGDRLAAQQVEIRNAGGGDLAWQARASQPWITLSPDRGVAPATLLVGIDAWGLSPGSHTGRVIIDAGGAARSPQAIDVSVMIATPRPPAPVALQASPDRVAFAAPFGQANLLIFMVRVRAEGDAGARWTARTDARWLKVTPTEGTMPATLTLAASPASMPIGKHSATVTIHAVGQGTDLRLPVSLAISAAADTGPLGFTTTSLPTAVLNVPYARAVSLRGGRPPYRVQLAGTLPPDLALIDGTIRGTPRSPGSFAFTLVASDASDPPSTVTGTLALLVVIVDERTRLAVTPERLQLSGTRAQPPEPVTVRVTSGGPPLTWTASASADWARVQPATGAAPGTFRVSAQAKDLEPGSYACTITVTLEGAPNSPVQIPVEFVVR